MVAPISAPMLQMVPMPAQENVRIPVCKIPCEKGDQCFVFESRRTKVTHKNRTKLVKKFHVMKCWLDVLSEE